MKVRDKLSVQFTLTLAVLLLTILSSVYLFAARNRETSFYSKLDDRAMIIAQFYLAGDNLPKENFKDIIRKFPQSLSSETIRIYSDDLVPKFIPEGSIRWPHNILKSVEIGKIVHLSDGGKQTTGLYYVDNSGNFIIMVSAVDDSGYTYLHNLRLVMVFSYLISLLINFVLGTLFSRMALSPIVRITSNLKRVRASSLDQRLAVAAIRHDEIDNLSLTINQLLEHLQQSFESQQAFISNASHELRTPITTILGEAEVALISDREPQYYQTTLNTIIKESDRLNNIINSLMELIQTGAANTSFENIRMDELIDEIVNQYDDGLIKVNYSFPVNLKKRTLLGNRHLLFIGLNNIIKNALKFSGNQPVRCKMFSDEAGIHILITDSGIGIDAKDIPLVFQPFYRAQNAMIFSGSGIGLSLTSKIIKLHNGTVNISSKVGTGTEFHLFFPN